jgi:flagellin-like hook-associated protein FlgL
MNFDDSQSDRLKTIFSKSAEYQATTEAKLNCLSEAYQQMASKALAAINAIEDDARRGSLAQDFATTLDRHLAVMEEFTCYGASEPLVISGTRPFPGL